MTSNATPLIEFKGVNKWYASNGYHVLRDVNLQFAKGEKVVICGPSGSGKSTLIRCINALEEYQEGSLTVDGTVLGDGSMNNARMKNGRVFGASIALAGVRAAVVTSVVRHDIRNSLVKS